MNSSQGAFNTKENEMALAITMLITAVIGFVIMGIGVLKASDTPLWDAITTGGLYVWLFCTIVAIIVALLAQAVAA